MNYRFFNILTFSILLLSGNLFGQSINYGLKYDGIGDNREFFSKHNVAETIFGSRIAFSAGTTVDSIHHVRAGLSYFYEYGSSFGEIPPKLILYYELANSNFGLKMGAFPRKEHIKMPLALISDKYEYYNPTVDGLMVSYNNPKSSFNFFADWLSRQDSLRREQFMAGFFGNYRSGNFLFEDYFYLFHNAGRVVREPSVHMEDAMGAVFLLGYDFSDFVPISTLTVKTGTLTSAFRSRGNGLDFEIGTSSYSEIVADYKGYGLEAFLKFGGLHKLTHGDTYYNSAPSYVRTSFYATLINFQKIKGKFIYSLHFTPDRMDHQQQFHLTYYFNQL
jgi:hypothetical protein